MTDNPSTIDTSGTLTAEQLRQRDYDSLGGGIKTKVRPRDSFSRAVSTAGNPAEYGLQDTGNKFLINLMLMLVQLINPDNKMGGGLMGLITKAFGMDDDQNHTKFRELKSRTATSAGREEFRQNHDYSNFDKGAARQAMRQGAELLSKNGPQTPNERQSRVMSVMEDAAKTAGIAPKLMVGVWGYESTWGTRLKSPTGCLGDFQFSRATMVEVMSKDGAKIADRLRANGKTEEAELVDAVSKQTKGMNGSQIKNFAAANKSAIDVLRMDPEISTYAAASHLKSVATQLRVDPTKTQNFGIIYAGYNIGVGNAMTIKNGGRASGWEVDANAGIAGRVNQAASYQNAMMGKINGATGQIVSQKISGEVPETTKSAFSSASTHSPKAVSSVPTGPSAEEILAQNYKPRIPVAAPSLS